MTGIRRRRSVRPLAFLVLLALCFAAGPVRAHMEHSYGESKYATLVLGLGYSGTPFAFVRDGVPRGFELDLARALAAEMGSSLEVRWLPRGELLAALEAGEVDLVNAAAVPGALPSDVDTVPFLLTGEHALVRKDNPFGIYAADDLSGTMVVATMRSEGEAFARELQAAIDATGRAPMDVHTLPAAQYTPVAVRFTHASAYFAPTAAAILQSNGPEAEVKIVPGLFKPTGRLAFALRAGDATLKRDLRSALAELVVKGTYASLLRAYAIPAECAFFR